MSKAKLTRRGKIVLTLIVFLIFWLLLDVTTPSECKVDFEELPQWCVGLLYP